MILIFNGDFTTNISMYRITDQDVDKGMGFVPYSVFTNKSKVENVFQEVGEEIPSQIIFIGKNQLYREIEKFYKTKNSEVQIIWQ